MTQIRSSKASLMVCVLVCHSIGFALVADDEDATPAQIEFFEKSVRPVLVKHCYQCHSVNAKRLEAGLLLDSRKGHIDGGDSGAAIVPGDADNSPLIEAVRYESYEMPPKGKLPDKDIEALAKWVNMGAPWPKEAAPTTNAKREKFDLDKRRSEFWVWQPIKETKLPQVKNEHWPRNDLDKYILASLEKNGLEPAKDAERTALLRRLYFDLIGLPPDSEEVKAFIADKDPGATEKNRRQAACVKTFRRALGAPLARPGSLCRIAWP